MDGRRAKEYFLARPQAWHDFPSGPDVYVFKVNARMSGTLAWEADLARINLKCEPEQAVILRDVFASALAWLSYE